MNNKTPSPPWTGICSIAPFSYTPSGPNPFNPVDVSEDFELSSTIKLLILECADQDPYAKDLSKDGTLVYWRSQSVLRAGERADHVDKSVNFQILLEGATVSL
jgi:hypothetical protein